MELLKQFLTDPVLFFSFTGLAVLLGISVFYVIYFIRNTLHDEAELKQHDKGQAGSH